MNRDVSFVLWRLQATLEVGRRKQEKLEEERAAAVRLCDQRTAQLQEMVIQAQQQCLESIRASDAAAAKANARADAAEARLAEVEKQLAPASTQAFVAEVVSKPTPVLEAPPEEPLLNLPNLSITITEPPEPPEPLEQPPALVQTDETQSRPRSPTSPLAPGILTPTAPMAPGMVQSNSPRSPTGSVKSEGKFDETKRSVKTLFVQCFKEDLFQERQLLMSQINNLFKLRNNGEALQYKEAGYEKLHNFLTDVAGLSLIGAGNRMELKLGDRDAFERFCDDLLVGREDLPIFDQPKPVPESFQQKVIEVFRRCGSREIPAKNFRDLWNCFFPHEKLQCKDYGYRDVKGLLANIPVVEKVGGKNSTKYVLKSEVDFPEKVLEEESFEIPPVASLNPQRLELRSYVNEQLPAMITPGLGQLEEGTEREAASRRVPRQGQAPRSKWNSNSSSSSQAWNEYGWPQQEMNLPGTQPGPGLQPFRSNDLPSQYPSSRPIVPQPQFLPQTPPHLQLPIQQQLLDLQCMGDRAAALPDPRFNQPLSHAEELLRLQQQVQTRLLQEQQRQQLFQQQLDTIQRPPAQSFPSQLSQGQFQPPLVQDSNRLPQYWNQASGDMDPQIAARSLSAQDQQPKPGEEIDQAAAGDDSLHLDLLLRATASASGRTRPDAETSAVSTRAARLARPRKSASAFVTSPATLRNADEDSTIHPSKFDVGSLYQGHLETLQNDRNCMLVHFANGRILFSNACCDRLFSTLTPLRHREVTEIIAEEDRVNFSSRIMYLSIGKFTVMERSTFNIITAKGVVPANIFGEHLMGSVWWMDCELVEEEA